MSEFFSPPANYVITAIERFGRSTVRASEVQAAIESTIELFGPWIEGIVATPYRKLSWLEEEGATPKVEAWGYAMGAGKSLAISILELLATGKTLAEAGEKAYSTKEAFCKAIISFYNEAKDIYDILYVKFPEVTEALEYFKDFCITLCSQHMLDFEELSTDLNNN